MSASGKRCSFTFIALAAVLGLTCVGCGGVRRSELPLSLRFSDRVVRADCPSGVSTAAFCWKLSGETRAARFGRILVGPLMDVEVPNGDPQCNKPEHGPRRLTINGSTLTLQLTWPTLCLNTIETVKGTFKVSSGTGKFARATGSGTISIAALSTGAAETLNGHISGPASP